MTLTERTPKMGLQAKATPLRASHEHTRSRPTLSVQTSQNIPMDGKLPSSIQVRYAKRAKYIQIQRFLVGVIRARPEKTNFAMVCILYDNMLNLERLSRRDPTFNTKFGKTLEALSKVLVETKIDWRSPKRGLSLLSSRLKPFEDFALPERNWNDIQPRLHNWVFLQASTTTGVERCMLPPRKVIGKGYTDKGSARKVWQDGSPKWQEVAMADIPLLQALQKLMKLTRPPK